MWRTLHTYIRGIRPHWQWFSRPNASDSHTLESDKSQEIKSYFDQDSSIARDESSQSLTHACDICENVSLQNKQTSIYFSVIHFGIQLSSFWRSFLHNHTIRIDGNQSLYTTVHNFLNHEKLETICSKCINNHQKTLLKVLPFKNTPTNTNLTEKIDAFLNSSENHSHCSACSSDSEKASDESYESGHDDIKVSSVDSPLMNAGRKFSEATEETVQKVNIYEACQYANKGEWTKAFDIWKEGSEKGCSSSHYNLGICYEKGHGVEINIFKALSHYQYAASKDHVRAIYNLAMLTLSNNISIEDGKTAPVELLRRAADMGFAHAQRELGVIYTDDENMVEAAMLFSKAAAQNDPCSQYYLGVCYENGWGIEKNLKKSIELYSQAASKSHHIAQYRIGKCYEQGLGDLEIDLNKAYEYYKLSLLGGCDNAKTDLERIDAYLERLKSGDGICLSNDKSNLTSIEPGNINSYVKKSGLLQTMMIPSKSMPSNMVTYGTDANQSQLQKQINYLIGANDGIRNKDNCNPINLDFKNNTSYESLVSCV